MTLRVVQANCLTDPLDRDPDALLAAWPTLPLIAEATAGAGAEVVVLQASRRPAAFTRRGVTYRFVPVPPSGRPATAVSAWRMGQAARRVRPDVIHLNGLDFPLHARALSRLGAPVLVQDHASQADRPRLAYLRRWGHAQVSAAAFTSRAQAIPFLASAQLPAGLPIFTAPESSSRFTSASREAARARTGLWGDPAVLWIGHLNANKDPLTLLRAAAQALDQLPGLQLWLAFIDASLLREMEAFLAAHPDLAVRTHLLGPLPHEAIEDLCRACDLFVSASRRESTGYALMEAMACGLPAVVSDIPAFRQIVGDSGAGALVPPGQDRLFAQEMIRLAWLPRAPLRRRVRAHFEAELSFEVIGRRLVDAYAAMAASPGRR